MSDKAENRSQSLSPTLAILGRTISSLESPNRPAAIHIAAFSLMLYGLAIPSAHALFVDMDIHYLNKMKISDSGPGSGIHGLSGITYVWDQPQPLDGKQNFWAVQDKGGWILGLQLNINRMTGAIEEAQTTEKFQVTPTNDRQLDFEGIAYTDKTRNTVFLSYEGRIQGTEDIPPPGIYEYSLAGNHSRTAVYPKTPEQFTRNPAHTDPQNTNARTNNGFESLTRSINLDTEVPKPIAMWTANEAALRDDGRRSTKTEGSPVRLVEYLDTGNQALSWNSVAQYEYVVDPLHNTPPGNDAPAPPIISGLSDLVALPDGGPIIALERSFCDCGKPVFLNKIYELDFTSATDVSGIADLVNPTKDGKPVKVDPVAKRLLFQSKGSFDENLEGLTLGPPLKFAGESVISWSLIGITDDNDSLLFPNDVMAFRLDIAVPEPSSGAILGVGLMAFWLLKRRVVIVHQDRFCCLKFYRMRAR